MKTWLISLKGEAFVKGAVSVEADTEEDALKRLSSRLPFVFWLPD